MKKMLLILLLCCFYSCAVNKSHFKHGLSAVYGQKYILSSTDMAYIHEETLKSQALREKCEREKLNCFFDPVYREAQFPGGEYTLREILHTNFKMQKDFRPSKNIIVLTISKNGKLKHYQIENDTNTNISYQLDSIIQNVLMYKKGMPAKVYGRPVDSQIKVDLMIF